MRNAVVFPGEVIHALGHEARMGAHHHRRLGWHLRPRKQQEAARLTRRQIGLEQQALGRGLRRQQARGQGVHHYQIGPRYFHRFLGSPQRAVIDHRHLGRLAVLLKLHAIQLATGHQEGADREDIGRLRVEVFGGRPDRLHLHQLAVGPHIRIQGSPRALDGRPEGLLVQEALVDAPGQCVGVQTGAAGFLRRVAARIEQACAPKAIGLLQAQYTFRHLPVLLQEARACRMLFGDVLQHPHQASEYPAVAPTPEHLLAVGFAQLEVAAVAEVQMLFLVVEIVGRAPPALDRKFHIACIARQLGQASPGWRCHEQGIAPGPAHLRVARQKVQCAVARCRQNAVELGAHRSDHSRITQHLVQLDISLADHLIVSVLDPATQSPAVPGAHEHHGVAILGAAGDSTQSHETSIANAFGPVVRRIARGMRQLPIGHTFHDG